MSPRPVPHSAPDLSGLVRLARGCWAESQAATDLASRCALLIATSSDHTHTVLLTAGRLHALWLPAHPDDVHLATIAPDTPGSRMTRTRRPEVVSHRRQIPEQDCVLVQGVAATSIARTWRDLAAILAVPDLVAAGDSALRRGATREQLADVIERTPGLRGARRARLCLPLLDERSRSRPESHLRVAVSGPDMPVFAVNEPVSRDAGGWLAEPDLSLVEARLALEYQGSDHGQVERMRKDITRAADLRSENWLCIMFGPAEVFGRPHLIKPEIRAAIAARAPGLLPARPRSRVVTYAATGRVETTTRGEAGRVRTRGRR